jgi:hypothetical protein
MGKALGWASERCRAPAAGELVAREPDVAKTERGGGRDHWFARWLIKLGDLHVGKALRNRIAHGARPQFGCGVRSRCRPCPACRVGGHAGATYVRCSAERGTSISLRTLNPSGSNERIALR